MLTQAQAGRRCPICAHATEAAGSKVSHRANRTFELRHCPDCRLTFIANPWTEYAKIYDRAYYLGHGADPLVDYVGEMDHPDETIRFYEWTGVLKAVRALAPVTPRTKWLDYGCGNGMLVRHVRQTIKAQMVGFEEGWIADEARKREISILKVGDLASHAGTCDIVTAIEVLEHVTDPLETLRSIRRLLKPGGLFFYTTGNAQPQRGRVAEWSYCIPEVHVSFYEPRTLKTALEATAFRTEDPGYLPGYREIIRFKTLKRLGYKRRGLGESLLPWSLLARVLESRLGIFRHPVGRAV